MTAKRAVKLVRRLKPSDDDLLDAFFNTLGKPDGRTLIIAVCDGCLTGAALAEKLGWTRDKASRRIGALAAGGLLTSSREGRWVRVTPEVTGVQAAKAWAGSLREGPGPDKKKITNLEGRLRRAELLADAGRRGLLTAIKAQPGSTQAGLARACRLSQPAASRSLTRLVDAGLVVERRAHGRAHHTLVPDAIESLWAWLESTELMLRQGREVAAGVVLPSPRPPSPSFSSAPREALRPDAPDRENAAAAAAA